MKILILGNFEYTNDLIYRLKGTPFLKENQIDLMYSVPKPLSKRKIIKYLKKLNFERLLIQLNLRFYKNSYGEVIEKLFPSRDISFVNTYKNIKLLKYFGLERIQKLDEYDFLIISTFSEKIPAHIYNKPKRRTLNIHPSYLPNLRGGYPTYVEAYQGSNTSGTSIHFMEDKYDNGALICQEEYNVDPSLNNNDRYKLSTIVSANFLNQLHINNFNISQKEQDIGLISYCHKIIKFKKEINSMPLNEDFCGFVRANYAKHLFPFTHLIKQFRIFSILSVKELNTLDNSILERSLNHKIIKINNAYFIKHSNKCFEITEYIWKGKYYSTNN
jgi:methionyl-tRNA formyltransferase